MRELVVLGTSSQVPTRERNHNGYLLRWDGERGGEGVLFDPGEGTQRQMTLAGVAASSVTRICLTHVHGDHCWGLPGVLSRMVLDGVEHPVHLHHPASGADVVRALVGLATPGLDLRLVPHGAAGPVAPGIEVVPLRHRVETFGYRVSEPDGWTVQAERARAAGVEGPDVGRLLHEGTLRGVRVEDVAVPRRGQRVAVVMDTAVCAGAEELADRADVLLVEATYADDDAPLAERYLHLTAGQAGALARGRDVRRLVLTHFSSRYADLDPLLRQATDASREPDGTGPDVVLAHDLQRVALPRRRAA
ncbi:ribonuclease Z [Actinotalea sp. AC32]|nr:ribonuclease Z [Actinotalea sp. AC32]